MYIFERIYYLYVLSVEIWTEHALDWYLYSVKKIENILSPLPIADRFAVKHTSICTKHHSTTTLQERQSER